MSDKKSTNQSTIKKLKRSSTLSGTASTSRVAKTASKESISRTTASIPRTKLNRIGGGDSNTTMVAEQEGGMPNFDKELLETAYGKFLREMLQDCLVDEKIEREATEMDIQMAQLADRLDKTIQQFEKTNRRVKDISFVVEQQRLLDLKSSDSSKIFNITESSKTGEILNNLNSVQQDSINKLTTKNVDFGYNAKTGHTQLLDAVNEAIAGLEDIKNHSKLDLKKFKEYAKSQTSVEELEKDRFDLESVKTEFEKRFPKFNEKLFKETSELLASRCENSDDNDEYD